MWDDILTYQAVRFITKATEDDEDKIYEMFDLIKERIKDHKIVVVLAKQWNRYNEEKQAVLAVHFTGMYRASMFMALMDYLSYKYRKIKSDKNIDKP
ncbi:MULTISPECIES: hypothetical protein [Bacillota]|uniref:hypothetical protein n=1 Tax=Bacillota TaxID=1239 RepID=UPI0009290A48|nr:MULTISPECIES: hypothetical protein [Bacillota]MDE1406999.1 hypothetical protein [Bacillus licheniformis]NFT30567.1 hypothetical protein [Clostridium sporogenes]OJT57318.1 hypothetical protein BFP47_11455 [Bacillus licheniformis]OJT70040.1 hypothetical protein BFP46_05435 [Bacillus licheniformis]TWM14721.1 hypothetical protein CHCC15091_1762 [Bacillus licheniformis]